MTLALWDWGFALGDVQQPVDVFYGDADDIISPEMPKRVAEELPNGTGHVWAGAGHYGFVDRERWTEFLSACAAPQTGS
jgi:pimeloyl-ACP methyl ester carboxylesterase